MFTKRAVAVVDGTAPHAMAGRAASSTVAWAALSVVAWLSLRAGPVLAASSAAAPAAALEVVDRVVAVIEDDIITLRELEEKAQPFMTPLEEVKGAAARAARRTEILRQVLDIEIGERIVTREIDKNRDKLGVSDQEVDRAIDGIMKDNRMTRDQLQAALYGQGMTWSDYKKRLRDQIERARLIQFRVQGKVQIKDADVKARCLERQRPSAAASQVCASHLLLLVPSGADKKQVEDLRQKAVRLQTELHNGADFSAYAMKYSDDKAAPDGHLGCFGKGDMLPAFEKEAFALPVGEVSPVVRTDLGFHIIKVTDRKTAVAGSCNDETTLGTIKNELYQQEMERQMNLWVTELRNKAFVEERL